MSTQWWQDGPEPRKIDVSVDKIYFCCPGRKARSYSPTAGYGESRSTSLCPSSSCYFLSRMGLTCLPGLWAQCRESRSGFHFQGLGSLAGTIQ